VFHSSLRNSAPKRIASVKDFPRAKAASGTKNDPLDAGLACELVRIHRDWPRPLPGAATTMSRCSAPGGFLSEGILGSNKSGPNYTMMR
jgi:hypothetical protein